MSITTHERPGVYSAYDASTMVRGGAGGKTVGLAAKSQGGTVGTVYPINRREQAAELFGPEDGLTKLAGLLLQNGAAEVRAVPVRDDAGYAAAFQALEREETVALVMCESTQLAVQQALRESVTAASAARHERIAVVCGGANETVAQLVARAEGLNSQRVVLVAPGGGEAAAAVAGAIAGESDPAVPLGGAALRGTLEVAQPYSDGELDTLIRGGVTALERIGGICYVVRGITTCTKQGGVADSTWRELSTILIVDEVIPALRNTLRAKFSRAKNTQQARGAIRSQVVLELESRVGRELILGYSDVSVTASAENPTVCLVDFSFTVAHGMNQIWLTAHIKV